MKKIILSAIVLVGVNAAYAQVNWQQGVNTVNNAVNNATGNNTNLSNADVIKGLKEALNIGTKNSSDKASKVDGFFKNPAIKIPMPPEAKKMETTLRGYGMNKPVDDFILSLNRAAEEAAKDAAPIFMNAITSMSISDGFTILKGADNAATQYLKDKTKAELMLKFKPVVQAALKKVQVTKYWNPLASKYNKIPMVKPVNPNLEEYVTTRAIDGLFKLIADEELKIRKDPGARVTDILKKVFGK
jgi:hypothetical protein